MIKGKILYAFLGLSIVANIAAAYFWLGFPSSFSPRGTVENGQKVFPYLAKRIFVENPSDILINFTKLRVILRQLVDKAVGTTNGAIGLYFEYLPTGNSIGINDREPFASASLVKTPVAMAMYRMAEKGRLRMDEKLTLRREYLDSRSGELWRKGENSNITIAEAVSLMLRESDNTAMNVLVSRLDKSELEEIYDSLDIPRELYGGDLSITPKGYSSIFRSLYFASSVSREASNDILRILSETPFHLEIPAGVPDGVAVSHKVGVIGTQVSGREETLSDCGIVYVPKRPYLLCLMVKSMDREKARQFFKEISQSAYQFVLSANP